MLLKIKIQFSRQTAPYEKNVKKQNCSLQKDLQILFLPFFDKFTVLVLIVINTIKNQKFNFPDKLCDIRKKC